MNRAAPGLLASLALFATGCLALPVASPPVRLQVGSGARSLATDAFDEVDVPAQVRAGIHPLALFPSFLRRRADFGVGYLLDYGGSATLNGAYLEAGIKLLDHELGGGIGRLHARAQARLIHAEPENAWGQAGALQVGWEFVAFADAPFEGSDDNGGVVGRCWGEGGVGVYLEGAYLRAGSLHGWTATAGLTLHAPASYGFAYMWIWALLK